MGRHLERRRFDDEESTKARAHAQMQLYSAELGVLCIKPGGTEPFVEQFNGQQFQEIQEAELGLATPAFSKPCRHKTNILHAEALAFVWALRHRFRAGDFK